MLLLVMHQRLTLEINCVLAGMELDGTWSACCRLLYDILLLQCLHKVVEIFQLEVDVKRGEDHLVIQSLICCRRADYLDCLEHVYLIIIFESLNGGTCHTLGLKRMASLCSSTLIIDFRILHCHSFPYGW